MVQPNSHKRDALQSQRQHDESSAEKKFIKANFGIFTTKIVTVDK